jgi:hypothetical protein
VSAVVSVIVSFDTTGRESRSWHRDQDRTRDKALPRGDFWRGFGVWNPGR